MTYSAAQIVASFLEANTTYNWGARSYSSEGLEQVFFTTPSSLIKITYDCTDEVFYIEFVKFIAGWGDYVRAISKGVHYILATLQAGGLDFEAPESFEAVEVTVSLRNGRTMVRHKVI